MSVTTEPNWVLAANPRILFIEVDKRTIASDIPLDAVALEEPNDPTDALLESYEQALRNTTMTTAMTITTTATMMSTTTTTTTTSTTIMTAMTTIIEMPA